MTNDGFDQRRIAFFKLHTGRLSEHLRANYTSRNHYWSNDCEENQRPVLGRRICITQPQGDQPFNKYDK